jgi:hypothetical protein
MTWQEGGHMRHRSGYVRSRREPLDQVTSTESLAEAPLLTEASFLVEAAEAVMVASNADPDDGHRRPSERCVSVAIRIAIAIAFSMNVLGPTEVQGKGSWDCIRLSCSRSMLTSAPHLPWRRP